MTSQKVHILVWSQDLASCQSIYKSEKRMDMALAGVAHWIERGLQTKESPVRFPVRAHARVAGQVLSGGHVRGNHTLMFLSLSFSLPFLLSKNK